MRDKLTGPVTKLYERLKQRLAMRKTGGAASNPRWERWRLALKNKFPENLNADPESLISYLKWIQRGLVVLGLYFLSGIAARGIGSFIKPAVPPPSTRTAGPVGRPAPKEDYDEILRRNMFNVEGTIPDPFDQGQLDCFSQARQSKLPIQLLGSIVMNDEKFSVALLQEEGNPLKTAVRKDDFFFNEKYQALKVERYRVCFQVRATSEMEFIEIPASGQELGLLGPSLQSSTEGITPVSENQFVVNQNFLEKNLLNLNDILQTARAVPYVEPTTGKFRGFLIQSIDANSPFTKLGVRQGDILTAVNDVVLDNAGKGLEAFQKLRNSPKIGLQVIRGGQTTSMTYDVQP